jgi:hypothetical protein
MLKLVFVEMTKLIDKKIIQVSYVGGVKILINIFFRYARHNWTDVGW